MALTTRNANKVGLKMTYKSESMLKLENFREELLRVKKEYYFGLSDIDFARQIGLSAEGYRKITNPDSKIRPQHTRSTTIYAIALKLDMNYEIKEEGGKQYVYFTKKEIELHDSQNVILDNELLELFTKLSEEQRAAFTKLVRHMSREAQDLVFNLIRQLSRENQI